MGYLHLPVRGGPAMNENPPTTAPNWSLAASDRPDTPNIGAHEGRITNFRTGPGDVSIISDQWMNPDIYVVPREGVMDGEQLFVQIPDPPNEGHGDGTYAQNGPVIDHSTTRLASFWSDWNASTGLQAGGRGSFTGEHVVIVRSVPGSVQGYMPSDPGMLQYNTNRGMPGPWDALLTIGTTGVGV